MTTDWVQALGEAMCAQWGIDPDECFGIHIHWLPGEVPYAEVDLRLNEGVVQQLLTLVPAGPRHDAG